VEFWANSTFFLEHLKGYSTIPCFQLPHGFVEILPTNAIG
jgi:hypothetical protein